MGMFDYVRCHMRLPVERESGVRCHGNPFQSKSVRSWRMPRFKEVAQEHGALTLDISSDGHLCGHDGLLLKWTGTMEFYGDVPRRFKWIEFEADVSDGIVSDVRLTDFES